MVQYLKFKVANSSQVWTIWPIQGCARIDLIIHFFWSCKLARRAEVRNVYFCWKSRKNLELDWKDSRVLTSPSNSSLAEKLKESHGRPQLSWWKFKNFKISNWGIKICLSSAVYLIFGDQQVVIYKNEKVVGSLATVRPTLISILILILRN